MTASAERESPRTADRWPGAHLSIRARLSLWYGLMVLLALVAAGVFVLWLQARLGLARVDEELDAATVTVAGVLRNELEGGVSLPGGVRDVMAELSLTGEGFAIVTPDGAVLGTKAANNPVLPDTVIQSAPATPVTIAAAAADTRIRSASLEMKGHRFRIVTWKSLAPLQAERDTLERAMLLGIPMTVLFAIAGGLSIGRRALRPLEAMARQAEAIGSQNLGARLTIDNPRDELGTLGHAFNGLLERLAASLRQQRTFMAEASHHLRTPVSVIRTAAQVMLSREQRPEAEYRESLDVVARQAQRLTKSVDDLFILTLADAEARPLQLTPLYLDELVGEVVDDLRIVAKAQHVTLRGDSAGETPYVGDEYLLRQMLTNLIENAIRHTAPEGVVTVSLTRRSSTLDIGIGDTGPGIAPEDVDRIFERFVRLGSGSAESGGGLGLPIARWIAEAHGGSLRLASTGPGGSLFLVTLPALGA